MQLHNLKSKKKKGPSARVGRGGKRGTYSGRGQKGQKSRAGRVIRKAERDLIIRLPKRRGFMNKPKSDKPMVFNVVDLVKKLKPALKDKNKIIDLKFLQGVGILSRRFKGEVKILGTGNIDIPVIFKGVKVSKSAKMKIEKAGGQIIAEGEKKAQKSN